MCLNIPRCCIVGADKHYKIKYNKLDIIPAYFFMLFYKALFCHFKRLLYYIVLLYYFNIKIDFRVYFELFRAISSSTYVLTTLSEDFG